MPPVDIALFGDSRILPVSAHDVGYPSCRFFNFALSGESIRSSVALMEHLAAIGKAPRLAIVGIDNFESQYFSNPTWLPPMKRWQSAWTDLAVGWQRQDVSMTNWLRMGWRHLHTSGESVRYMFARQFLISGANLWLDTAMPTGNGHEAKSHQRPHYRIDGSLSYGVAGKDGQADIPLPSAPEQIIVGYLRHDLQRLARQERDGRRVIIYESPVAPTSTRRFAQQPSAYAKFHRETFLEECRKLGLACQADPGLFAPDAGWRDSSHPPPGPLGAYIQTLISEAVSGDRESVCNNDL